MSGPSSDRTTALDAPVGSGDGREIRVRWAAITDTGLVRTNNEDASLVSDLGPGSDPVLPEEGAPPSGEYIVGPKGVLLSVSDGMGGQEAGEVASAIAVRKLASVLQEQWSHHADRDDPAELRNDLRTAVARANRAVLDHVVEHPERAGMGATLTAAVVFGRLLLVAHVGDSRCYLLRDGHLKCLTADQSLAEELVRRGIVERGTAAYEARKSVLTRVVGQQGKLEPDAEIANLASGDRLLICSDGLYGPVDDESIAAILEAHDDPAVAAEKFVAAAKDNGAPDNVTCVCARVFGDGLPSAADLEDDGGTMSIALDAELVAKAGDATVAMDAVAMDAGAANAGASDDDGPDDAGVTEDDPGVDFEAATMTLGAAESPRGEPAPEPEADAGPAAEAPVPPPAASGDPSIALPTHNVPLHNVIDEHADTEAMDAHEIEKAIAEDPPAPPAPRRPAADPAPATGDPATVAIAVIATAVALIALVYALASH